MYEDLTEREWTTVAKVVEVFGSTYEFTKKIQATLCTLSDFYGYWLRMEIAIRKCLDTALPDDDEIAFDLPQKMLDSMQKYRGDLLNNPILLAAVFLDPRFSSYLKMPYKPIAIAKLISIWDRIHTKESINTDDDLEIFLASDVMELTALGERNIHDKLEQFTQLRPEKAVTNVLQYWESKKHHMPELYLMSRVVYCVPPTQAATERANSNLSFVYGRLRTSIGQTLLQDILLIRSNADMFHAIVKERLNKC